MERYAVIGNPVAHSLSPFIHAGFARQFNWRPDYGRLECAPEKFAATVREFMRAGGKGLNVTLPFKEQALELAGEARMAARVAGAANVLWFDNGVIGCDNTDGAGLVRDMTANHGIKLTGQRLMVLGAGGATRGILEPLHAAGAQEILLANRTLARAVALAEQFDGVRAVPIETPEWEPCDGILNATAASLQGALPGLAALPPGLSWGYDLAYSEGPTPFVEYLRAGGVERAFDGLGMLIEQAILSFQIWHGVTPAAAPVAMELRASLRQRGAPPPDSATVNE